MNVLPRQVILVRHAHAEWPSYAGRDFDRPLTARGLKDATAAALAIKAAGHRPDLLLASPARRTRQTAEIIAARLALPDRALRYADSIYNASPLTLEGELLAAATAASTVLLVAHNPGVSELARLLVEDPQLAPFSPAQWRCITRGDA